MVRLALEGRDDGTNDLLVSNVIRTNETQVWFLSRHLVNGLLAREISTAFQGSKTAEAETPSKALT